MAAVVVIDLLRMIAQVPSVYSGLRLQNALTRGERSQIIPMIMIFDVQWSLGESTRHLLLKTGRMIQIIEKNKDKES